MIRMQTSLISLWFRWIIMLCILILSRLSVMMDYDAILDVIGHFSRWHQWQNIFLTLFQTAAVFATLSYSFTGNK